MAGSSQYFVRSSVEGRSFLEFGYSYGSVTMDGEEVEFVGSSLTDVVAVSGGVSLDFSNTRDGADVLYVPGTWSEYSKKKSRSALSLTGHVDGSEVTYNLARGSSSAGDVVVFADGQTGANNAWNKAELSDPGLDPSHTSAQLQVPELAEVEVAGFARATQSGSVFASFRRGVSLKVTGSNNVDVVYVQEGGEVDATNLREGKDKIYLRGRWSDYEKIKSRSSLTFRREVAPDTFEVVSVSRATQDEAANLILFADGAILSSRAFLYADQIDFASLDGYIAPVVDDDTTATPLGSGGPNPSVQSFAASAGDGSPLPDGTYNTGETILITATMDRPVTANSSFEVTLNTGAVVTLTAAQDGETLQGAYVIAAGEATTDLTILSYTTGTVEDVEGNDPMVSTQLPPPAKNISGASDIMINTGTVTSALAGETSVDVRSDIVLQLGGGPTELGNDGTYTIRLVNTANTPDKDGFLGETSVGSQEITFIVENGAIINQPSGGTVQIVDGRLVINPDHDLDLDNTYVVIFSAGMLKSTVTGLTNEEVTVGNGPAFATVSPSTPTGTVGRLWDAALGGVVDGDTWFDGAQGNYVQNHGVAHDLTSVSGIVVMGRDVSPHRDYVELTTPSRAVIDGFGADDRLYVDMDTGAAAKQLNADTIPLAVSLGGESLTAITFSGTGGLAGAIIRFANNQDTTEVNESLLTASGYTTQSLQDAGLSHLKSFEEITGVAMPIIIG